jgi:tRNA splicing endonuclease
MCTHSEYVVSIRDYEEPILPLEIIGMGRVTTNVKKTFVLASATAAAVSSSERPLLEDTDTEQEEDAQEKMMTYYYSIEWAGF